MQDKRMAVWTRLRMMIAAVTVLLCVALAASALIWPEPTGKKQAKQSGTVIDYTNAADGYIMVKQSAGKKKYKLRIQKGDQTYTYNLNNKGDWEIFPLQMGTGSYKVSVYKNSSGSKYSSVSSQNIKVEGFNDENACFLCPNQYILYEQDSIAVAKSNEICAGLTSDAEKIQTISDYILRHIHYDYIQALTVEKGYLPDVDQIITSGNGICFDYAALFACMLRVQNIPTQLAIGYADNTYHSWNLVLVDGKWTRYDLTAQSTSMRVKTYTIERIY